MGEIEKLALITDALEQIAPSSKIFVAFELEKKVFDDFFRKLNTKSNEIYLTDTNKFSVDISGVKFYFICEGAE